MKDLRNLPREGKTGFKGVGPHEVHSNFSKGGGANFCITFVLKILKFFLNYQLIEISYKNLSVNILTGAPNPENTLFI